MLRARPLVALVALLGNACTLFTDLGGLSGGGAAPTADASPPTAEGGTDAGADGATVHAADAAKDASGPSYVEVVREDRPRAHWRLLDPFGVSKAKDETGRYDGVYEGECVRVSGGVDFRGACKVTLPEPALEATGTSELTVEAWVSFKPPAAYLHVVTWQERALPADEPTNGYAIVAKDDALYFERAGGGVNVHTPFVVVSPVTHHVAAVYAAGAAQLYIDGVLRGSAAMTQVTSVFVDKGLVGAKASGSGGKFVGVIGDVAFYPRALEAERIAAHAAAGARR